MLPFGPERNSLFQTTLDQAGRRRQTAEHRHSEGLSVGATRTRSYGDRVNEIPANAVGTANTRRGLSQRAADAGIRRATVRKGGGCRGVPLQTAVGMDQSGLVQGLLVFIV